MLKHLLPFILLVASLQSFASFNPTLSKGEGEFQLHWTLPTTLDGIRQERANLNIKEEPMPACIMCQNSYVAGYTSIAPEATDVSKEERYWTVKRDLTLASVPYIVLGITAHAIKRDVRKINSDINTGFHNSADDYIQWAPLALT